MADGIANLLPRHPRRTAVADWTRVRGRCSRGAISPPCRGHWPPISCASGPRIS